MGDDKNVFPYIDYNTYDRMDVSKLDQWEIIFEHAQKLGLFLHFKTFEKENQGLLDNGGVGAYTKLYYRELIARYGHHLALNWNIGEENGDLGSNNRHITPPQTTMERISMAQCLYDIDPYHHHIVIHNGVMFDDLLGPISKITGPSLQTSKEDFTQVHDEVVKWRKLSAEAGKKWAVSADEPGNARQSLVPDKDDDGVIHANARKNGLWGAFMAGAWGIEWYFGYAFDHSDLTCQDYRSRDTFWDYNKYLLEFFQGNNIPFHKMEPMDQLTSNGYCFASKDEVYVAFIPKGGTTELTLGTGKYSVKWFNPRKGGKLQNGSVKMVNGSQTISIGSPPSESSLDWVALIKNENLQAM